MSGANFACPAADKPVSAPDARAFFLLSRQEKEAKEKASPARRRIDEGDPVPCATRRRRGLRNSALRASDSPRPFSAGACVARRRAGHGAVCDGPKTPTPFQNPIGLDLPPLPSRRAAQGRRGDVGEDCLSPRAARASSAAAPAFRAAQGTDSAASSPNRRDGGVAFFLGSFSWRNKKKNLARQARNLTSNEPSRAAGIEQPNQGGRQ
jgi:hypothetical protein